MSVPVLLLSMLVNLYTVRLYQQICMSCHELIINITYDIV